jgi:exopolyphosphatase / guanosine-5'-triphosphate,3'-diphosphate pyrophosphatase
VHTAVIDIGTNTLLLLIVDEHGVPVVDLCRFGRLGQGLDATGRLAPEAIARSLEICRDYRRVLDAHDVAQPIVIATQATREARNAAELVIPAEAILGARIEVIAGAREAELAFVSVARTFLELAAARHLVVDVGGGSTEIIVGDAGRVVSATSVPIGAVRLAERHLAHDPPTPDEVAALCAGIDRALAPLALPSGVAVIGTSGTATTIAALALGLARYDAAAVTGLSLAPAAVARQLDQLLAATVAERRALPGMEPERADVVPAGVAIYARILQHTHATALVTCDRGVRWGIVHEQLDRRRHAAGVASP